eukprot:scaffold313581_cov34-Attheya_sp.AAC.3
MASKWPVSPSTAKSVWKTSPISMSDECFVTIGAGGSNKREETFSCDATETKSSRTRQTSSSGSFTGSDWEEEEALALIYSGFLWQSVAQVVL